MKIQTESRDLENPVSSLYADLGVFVSPTSQPTKFWFFGQERPQLIRAVSRLIPGLTPVLIGREEGELFRDRELLASFETMGFLRDLEQDCWERGLPWPVAGIGLSYHLSGFDDPVRQDSLKIIGETLQKNGLLIWTDYFLPQTLELQELYLESYTRCYKDPDESAQDYQDRFRQGHSNLILIETAISEIYQAGFANLEIIFKRLGLAVILARK